MNLQNNKTVTNQAARAYLITTTHFVLQIQPHWDGKGMRTGVSLRLFHSNTPSRREKVGFLFGMWMTGVIPAPLWSSEHQWASTWELCRARTAQSALHPQVLKLNIMPIKHHQERTLFSSSPLQGSHPPLKITSQDSFLAAPRFKEWRPGSPCSFRLDKAVRFHFQRSKVQNKSGIWWLGRKHSG